ncbi:hypothetical protein LTR08_007557 [Meristemomyces frigidus]|nr:hypothetical protein LTR08_007557 [Meristemomyces frigidus]
MSDRARSASPAREPKPKKQKSSGFKWKEKKRDEDGAPDSRDSGRLERGYRDRSPKRDSYRDRESKKDQDAEKATEGVGERKGPDSHRPLPTASSANTDAPPQRPAPEKRDTPKDRDKSGEKKKSKKPRAPVVSNEPMIVVNINDRLGTKAAIPCLASDSIKAFKAIVAANIGRQPHEIMLKRQGERPFKDQLTLADYGVSNGVQLDLELDTGD